MRAAELSLVLALFFSAHSVSAQEAGVRTGATAHDSWKADAPGVQRLIVPSDLPAPQATEPEVSLGVAVKVVPPPQGALPKVPKGFAVEVFASGFKQPRTLRIAPNGDIFLAESGAGRVLVFRNAAAGAPAKQEVFAEGLDRPYGVTRK